MLDSNLLDFINNFVDSVLAWDIIMYWASNPHEPQTVKSLVNRFAREPEEIKEVLRKLEEKGLIFRMPSLSSPSGEKDLGITEATKAKGEVVYFFIPNSGFREQVDYFSKALSDRKLRLAILSKVLRKEEARQEKESWSKE